MCVRVYYYYYCDHVARVVFLVVLCIIIICARTFDLCAGNVMPARDCYYLKAFVLREKNSRSRIFFFFFCAFRCFKP